MNKYWGLLVGLFAANGIAQTTILSEDFNSGIPSSWTLVDVDGNTPALFSPVFSSAWIHYQENGDTCAASTSYYDPSGSSEDYLITPKLSIASYTKLWFQGKSVDASYPDGYVVLVSTTDSLTSSFTDTLLYIAEEAPYWQSRTVLLDTMGYNNQDVFIAFKNVSNDKFILLLDNIKVSTSDNLKTENVDEEIIAIYPNPTQDFFFVNTTNTPAKIELYNLQGELVKTTTASNKVTVQELCRGQYIAKIIFKEKVYTQKVVLY